MISPETRAHIRRLHHAEKWPVGTIATELGVHHGTVESALDDAQVTSPDTSTGKATVLSPYTDFVDATLKAHPRPRATRLFHMVKARGYPGSYEQVKRYVRHTRPAPAAEAFLRRTTLPGEEAQVDWGSFGEVQVGRAWRTLSCFVLVLGHSRAMYARFFLGQRVVRWLRCLRNQLPSFLQLPKEALVPGPVYAARARGPLPEWMSAVSSSVSS